MGLRESFHRVVDGYDLTAPEAGEALDEIVSGQAPSALVAGFLVALRMKGETPQELAGLATALLSRAIPVAPERRDLVDTCGTGGDGTNTMNISTAAALVLAGAGLGVAKHGNVGLSSRSGSADVLEALGVPLNLNAGQVAACIDRAGIGFIFARAFHPAFGAVAAVRKELAIRTSFNLLGPLVNPARPSYQLVGVGDPDLASTMAGALAELGTKRSIVVSGAGGCDELTLEDDNLVFVVRDGAVSRHTASASDAGLASAPAASLAGGTPEENAKTMRRLLEGQKGPVRDCVVFNAGAALVACEAAPDLRAGVALAGETLDSGAAGAALERLLAVSAQVAQSR